MRSFFYGYGHLIIYPAIVAVGVGVEVAIERVAEAARPPTLLGWATAALIAGFLVIGNGMGSRPSTRKIVPINLALAVLAVILCSAPLPSVVASAGIAAGWLALVVVETRAAATRQQR